MKKNLLLISAPKILGTENAEGFYLQQDPDVLAEIINKFPKHYIAPFTGTLSLVDMKERATPGDLYTLVIWEEENGEHTVWFSTSFDLAYSEWNQENIDELPEYFILLAQKDAAEKFKEIMKNFEDLQIDIIYSEIELGSPDLESQGGGVCNI